MGTWDGGKAGEHIMDHPNLTGMRNMGAAEVTLRVGYRLWMRAAEPSLDSGALSPEEQALEQKYCLIQRTKHRIAAQY